MILRATNAKDYYVLECIVEAGDVVSPELLETYYGWNFPIICLPEVADDGTVTRTALQVATDRYQEIKTGYQFAKNNHTDVNLDA